MAEEIVIIINLPFGRGHSEELCIHASKITDYDYDDDNHNDNSKKDNQSYQQSYFDTEGSMAETKRLSVSVSYDAQITSTDIASY